MDITRDVPIDRNYIYIGRHPLKNIIGTVCYHEGICIYGRWFELKGLGGALLADNKILENKDRHRRNDEWCNDNRRHMWTDIAEHDYQLTKSLSEIREWNEDWLEDYPQYSMTCIGGANCQKYVSDLLEFMFGVRRSHQVNDIKSYIIGLGSLALSGLVINNDMKSYQIGDDIEYRGKIGYITDIYNEDNGDNPKNGLVVKIQFDDGRTKTIKINLNSPTSTSLPKHGKSIGNLGKTVSKTAGILLAGHFVNKLLEN